MLHETIAEVLRAQLEELQRKMEVPAETMTDADLQDLQSMLMEFTEVESLALQIIEGQKVNDGAERTLSGSEIVNLERLISEAGDTVLSDVVRLIGRRNGWPDVR